MVFLVKESSLQITVRIVKSYLFIIFNDNTLTGIGKIARGHYIVILPLYWTWNLYFRNCIRILCSKVSYFFVQKVRKF